MASRSRVGDWRTASMAAMATKPQLNRDYERRPYWHATMPALPDRSGKPLPGSADWTHEHADASNTRVSRDQLVKAPLGLLWFGGSSNEAILPRHGHGRCLRREEPRPAASSISTAIRSADSR